MVWRGVCLRPRGTRKSETRGTVEVAVGWDGGLTGEVSGTSLAGLEDDGATLVAGGLES